MPLRIGFDMDGTLADFRRAFRDVEVRLFGPGPGVLEDQPEREEAAQSSASDGAEAADAGAAPLDLRRRRRQIWREIQATADFWRTLRPLDAGAVARIHRLMLEHRWEVFFVTQRPYSDGDTVQRQTQKWLVDQGFDLPSVLVLGGSRGAAAAALRLDYHVDDSLQNCLDVMSAAAARPILIVSPDADRETAGARQLGIATAASIGEALDILERATLARAHPGLFARLASLVGWR